MTWSRRLTLPFVVEPELLRPIAYHAPAVKSNNADGHSVEHGFCAQPKALLDVPEREDPDGLRDNTDDQEVRER